MAKILILDNYDSFTYNLVHYVEDFDKHDIEVYRNDEIDTSEIERFDGIIISPGPGIPKEAGLTTEIIGKYYKTKRIFGVCLGMQAIAEVFGAKLINISKVYHGVASKINLLQPHHYIFDGMDSEIEVGRYHSWIVDNKDFPACLNIKAIDQSDQIMAIEHKDHDVCGVQFHPESVLTPNGKETIYNWLKRF